jgi:hypothetical protein
MPRETILETAARFGREYYIQCVEMFPGGFKNFAPTDNMPDCDYVELKRTFPYATDDELNAAWDAYRNAFNESN